MVRLFKVKPPHGWNAVAWELAIVTLGVLIALGAQQVADEWHWRGEVAGARAALSDELADSIGEGGEREKIYGCIERRLDFLAETIDRAADAGRLPPLATLASPPYRTWLNTTWQTVVAGQTASHFSRHELNRYSNTYVFVEDLQQLAPRELTVWSRLDAIAGPGRPVTPSEIAALRNDISEARLVNRLTTVAGMRLREAAASVGLSYDKRIIDSYVQTPTNRYPVCAPMGTTPPSSYGSAPLEHGVANARTTRLVMSK